MIKYLLTFFSYLPAAFVITGQSHITVANEDSIALSRQLQGFIESFEKLDFARFQTFLLYDVTCSPSAWGRIEGREKNVMSFQDFFQKSEMKIQCALFDISKSKNNVYRTCGDRNI
jgi:diadenosine tetraphosphatase ApaH/serine/threonine PP2A family protein phosphatase